ncbi:unnamed protein product [Zymoseptoria tritici ST99CH_3D7]|uniref:Integral membrane protein n=1 Tax=Zymoseptoria tritici (strain ST99CH_3D7) TaxID=1276538 RepID=A0A1X7RIU9_ZYMT9|nr:unnamed protein product [Zymoseptoria tritici ST99CH_3D7]
MDYFNNNDNGNSQGQGQGQGARLTQQNTRLSIPRTPGGARSVQGAPSYESLRIPSNIRIRRLPSFQDPSLTHVASPSPRQTVHYDDNDPSGRRRSFSAPGQRPSYLDGAGPSANTDLSRQFTTDGSHMPAIREGEQATPNGEFRQSALSGRSDGLQSPRTPGISAIDMASGARTPTPETFGTSGTAMHSAGNAAQRSRGFNLNRFRSHTAREDASAYEEYDSDVIDLLDLVDPEVRTLATLTNLQNSMFVPDLGGLVNRRPTYNLTRRPTHEDAAIIARSRANSRAIRRKPVSTQPIEESIEMSEAETPSGLTRKLSVSSQLSDSHYAVLPHGVSLSGWHEDDIAELNDHVRHLLHSKREGFKRSWRGFRQYVSRPLGLFIVVYATLVTLFGAAWVFALIGWIYVGNRQDYIINIIDLTLVALFAVMGDGLAPFRAVDTYHMFFIARYHRITRKRREKKNLPTLVDPNDLPNRRQSATSATLPTPGEDGADDIIDKEELAEYSVLTPRQQQRLQYHQAKFNKSHTFYKPHETSTHHAFPLRHMVAAVVLLDCHSLLQIALGTCTWSIDYRVRPEALTATILSFSIACNIAAGVVISIGDHKTRKKDVLEKMFRQTLTEEAMKRMAKKHERGEMGLEVNPGKVESEDIVAAAQTVAGVGGMPKKKPRKSEDLRGRPAV